jgi:DNA-binding transcriptional MerR regulator
MHIGKISELTGASRKAIRHYEAIGLLPAPERVGKYRVYTDMDVVLITIIKRAQSVGFSLAQLSGLISYKAKHNQFPLAIALDLIRQKRDELSREQARLQKLNEDLNALQDELNTIFAADFSSQKVCVATAL